MFKKAKNVRWHFCVRLNNGSLLRKDILALRIAVLAAITNADTRLYTPFQALRSTRDIANLRSARARRSTLSTTAASRPSTRTRRPATGGRSSRTTRKVKCLSLHPDHDCSRWVMGDNGYKEPQGDEAQALYD